MFHTDDLEKLLFRGENTPSGSYSHGHWGISSFGDESDLINKLVSIHEGMHDNLNQTTAYGNMLLVFSHLNQSPELRETFGPLLKEAVKRCRNTHESYATFRSLYVLSSFIAKQGMQSPLALLENYPGYLKHYTTASELGLAGPGLYISDHAITSALRVCMQCSWIQDLAKNGFEDWKLNEIRLREFPDYRLKIMKGLVKEIKWDLWLKEAKLQGEYLLGWREAEEEMIHADPALLDSLRLNEEFDDLSNFLLSFFHDQFSQLMAKAGYTTLPYDGHLAYSSKLVEEANRWASGNISTQKLVSPAPEDSDEKLTLEQHQQERYLLSSSPIRARADGIHEIEMKKWQGLESGMDENRHHFLVFRPANHFLDQYRIEEEAKTALKKYKAAPLAALQRSKLFDEERIVDLAIFEDVKQYERFSKEKPGNWPIIVAQSAETLVRTSAWQKEWQESFRNHSHYHFYLLDISPFRFFDYLSRENIAAQYGYIVAEVDQSKRWVFCIQIHRGLGSELFISPCSAITCNSMIRYLEHFLPVSNQIRADQSFLEEKHHRKFLPNILGHLFREAHFYEFHTGIFYA